MDETLKKIIKETSKITGVPEERVQSIINFQNNKTEELIKNYDKNNIAEIKIPYICRIKFNPLHYEKFMEKMERKKNISSKSES